MKLNRYLKEARLALVAACLPLAACSTGKFKATEDPVDLPRFMGKWYVITGRTTFLEKGAHNSVEIYTWNAKEERIDIDFTFRKDRFDGPLKSLPQKAWIENKATFAYWKVQPFWPLKFDYLILDVTPDYQLTAIGVPAGDKLWIMARSPEVSEATLSAFIQKLGATGYPVGDLVTVPQSWK